MATDVQITIPTITNSISFTVDSSIQNINIVSPTISQNITVVIFSQ